MDHHQVDLLVDLEEEVLSAEQALEVVDLWEDL